MADPAPAPQGRAPSVERTGVLSADQVQAALAASEAASLDTAHIAPESGATIDVSASRVGRIPAPAPDARDEQGKPFGRYRLLVELGRGGMGIVWKAWDKELRRVVALKQILSEGAASATQVERFMREARLAAKLRHPGIVGVLDVGHHEAQPYFTTEYVDGRPLDQLIREGVDPRRAAAWTREVADALAYAHENGVVHRDVKPGNVLVDGRGKTFVMDFGLAREVELGGEGASQALRLTQSGALIGTPQYMSPEQASGDMAKCGPASDQFSLGAVLYEMLAGRPPFDGDGLREVLNAVAELDPVPVRRLRPKVDRDLETVCLKALEKDPARRYPTTRELAADLGRWLDGEPIEARAVSLSGRLARRARKHRWVVLPSVAAVVAAFVGAGLFIASEVRRSGDLDDARKRSETERAARDAALAGKAEAEAVLDKGGRAQNVVARWLLLAEPLAKMERAWYDTTRDEAERRDRAMESWPAVQGFLEETPPDHASQATARAFGAYARVLAGNDDGWAWFQEARELDPDLPYADLIEAFTYLGCYLACAPIPAVALGPAGPQPGPTPPESDQVRTLREAMEKHLAAASKARVWGQGMAGEFRRIVEALQALLAGRHADAESALTSALGTAAVRTFRGDIQLARAKMRYLLGRYADALLDLDQVRDARPNCGEVYYFRGVVCHGQGMAAMATGGEWRTHYERGVAELGKAIRYRPELAEAFSTRAILRRALGDVDGAIEDLDACIARLPGNYVAFVNRGVAKQTKGDFEGALADYNGALALEPRIPAALANRANVKLQLGDRDGARKDYDAALELDARMPQAWYNRGLLREAQGDDDGAEDDYSEALRLAPGFRQALYARGLVRSRAEDDEGAAADIEAALRVWPADDPGRAQAEEALAKLREGR